MKARIYSANVNGTPTQVKAYKKENALARFWQLGAIDLTIDMLKALNVYNSHQSPVEELYPEICK